MKDIWFESGGVRLYAVEQGAGDPIVFLHGGLADHRGAAYRAGGLAADHRLITPDVRGAGRSHFAGTLSWPLLADDIVALLDHLRLERAVIGGTSAGSAAAVACALRHPARVRALIAAMPVFAGTEHALPAAAAEAMQRMDEFGQRAARDGIEALLPLFDALPEPMRSAVKAMASTYDPASVAATTRLLASDAQPFERLADLAALRMPVLVVPGADPQHPAEVGELYLSAIAGAVRGDPSADLAAEIRRFLAHVA